MKPWFLGKLDFAPTVIDLTDQGYPLYSGRLDYLNHRSVAALVHHARSHAINVFVSPDGDEAPVARQTQNGIAVVGWTAAGMQYCAVSDLNLPELAAFSRVYSGGATAGAIARRPRHDHAGAVAYCQTLTSPQPFH